VSDSPARGEILSVLKRVVERAEERQKLQSRFAWHRRFLLRIDSTLETAERRLLPQNLSGDRELDSAVEMTVAWLKAQNEPEDSIERASCLYRAQELLNQLS
jgi:hypothetical protein